MADNFVAKDGATTNLTFDSKDIGGGVQRPRHEIASAPAGAITDLGNSTSTAAITTDTAGTVLGFLRGLVKLFAARVAVLGQALAAASQPVVIASDQSAVATTNTGGVKFNGVQWTPIDILFDHTDASTLRDVLAAPGSLLFTVVDELEVSVNTAMEVAIKEETTGVILWQLYMAANSTVTVSRRSGTKFSASAANKKLQVLTSVAGKIAIRGKAHSEA